MSLQLKQLETNGLITRKVYANPPPLKVVYSLTPFGNTVTPALKIITEWGITAAYEKGEFIEVEK